MSKSTSIITRFDKISTFSGLPAECEILLKKAKIELAEFKKRYKTLSELEEIFKCIDEL